MGTDQIVQMPQGTNPIKYIILLVHQVKFTWTDEIVHHTA